MIETAEEQRLLKTVQSKTNRITERVRQRDEYIRRLGRVSHLFIDAGCSSTQTPDATNSKEVG